MQAKDHCQNVEIRSDILLGAKNKWKESYVFIYFPTVAAGSTGWAVWGVFSDLNMVGYIITIEPNTTAMITAMIAMFLCDMIISESLLLRLFSR